MKRTSRARMTRGAGRSSAGVDCRLTSESLDRVLELARAQDREAVMKFVLNPFNACKLLMKGTSVTVEDVKVFSDQVLLRERGEPSSYWTVAGAVS